MSDRPRVSGWVLCCDKKKNPTGIASIHKETNTVIDKFWKKGGAVVHAITLVQERLIDLHIA